jgi:hypothetical protein
MFYRCLFATTLFSEARIKQVCTLQKEDVFDTRGFRAIALLPRLPPLAALPVKELILPLEEWMCDRYEELPTGTSESSTDKVRAAPKFHLSPHSLS